MFVYNDLELIANIFNKLVTIHPTDKSSLENLRRHLTQKIDYLKADIRELSKREGEPSRKAWGKVIEDLVTIQGHITSAIRHNFGSGTLDVVRDAIAKLLQKVAVLE